MVFLSLRDLLICTGYEFFFIIAVIAMSFVNGFAQWQSAQKDSASAETHWDGFCLDSSGNMFCAGISDKFPAPDTRKIVITKFDKDLNKIWDVRLVGGATIYHTSIGVDAAGNSFTIGKFTGTVTRTDGSKFTSASSAHFIIYLVKK